MKNILILFLGSTLLFSCQKKEEDKKASKEKEAIAGFATALAKAVDKGRKIEKDEKAGSESSLVNSAEAIYSVAGGRSKLKVKHGAANPCMVFNTQYNEGQYSLNLAFADKDASINVVSKANQALLKELFIFAIDNAEKKNATLEGMSSFLVGDGKLRLKVKEEEFTSDKCEVSAKPRLYKTNYDYPGYELELTCSDVKQVGIPEAQKTLKDGQIKVTAHCGLGAQK